MITRGDILFAAGSFVNRKKEQTCMQKRGVLYINKK